MFKADEKMFDVVTGLRYFFFSDYPVYHTAFDSYDWMIHNADPLFHRHVASNALFLRSCSSFLMDPLLSSHIFLFW
ncbi:unnamed protein product [Brassica napus]|uniref:(rape) hypothetical protein n=1 Tax=Brassica napus TaxID=3708 RepID=A0A816QD43_BRANA|nr:unnamed protein product [Brassica napus]